MIIRVDKCSTFGITKRLTESTQYFPKLIINNSLIPAIELGKSFCYLGRYFDFEMTNNEHKLEMVYLITPPARRAWRSYKSASLNISVGFFSVSKVGLPTHG